MADKKSKSTTALMQILADLEPKRQKFVTAILSGANGVESARAGGWTGTQKSLRTRAWQLLHRDKKVMAALDAARAELAEQAGYGHAEAMGEIDAGIAFAIKTENATAYAKFCELRLRLTGQYSENLNIKQQSLQISISGID